MSTSIESQTREEMTKAAIRAFVELVLGEKFNDIPDWMTLDLTVSQVRAIYHLAFRGPLSVTGLARLLGLGVPAASVLVQQLVEQNLAERTEDPQDRRRSRVRLTARGAELVSGRRDLKEAKFRRRMSQMSDAELSSLLRGLQALAAIVRQEQTEPVEASDAC